MLSHASVALVMPQIPKCRFISLARSSARQKPDEILPPSGGYPVDIRWIYGRYPVDIRRISGRGISDFPALIENWDSCPFRLCALLPLMMSRFKTTYCYTSFFYKILALLFVRNFLLPPSHHQPLSKTSQPPPSMMPARPSFPDTTSFLLLPLCFH